jgi:transposase
MSTSLLYHSFGVSQVVYRSTSYQGGATIFHVEPHQSLLCCKNCNSRNVVKNNGKVRMFQTVPVGARKHYVMMEVPYMLCKDCGKCLRIHLPFVDGKKTYTRKLERYILDLSRLMTMQDVADLLEIDWHVVKDVLKRDLQKRYTKPPLKNVKVIAVDEICIGKGHKYITLVIDLETGAVIYIGEGKGSDALTKFWVSLKKSRAKVKAVAADLSPAYTKAIRENLPKAKLVYDHFHIIKLFNDKLSQLRRNIYNSLTDDKHKSILKGTRWLLLKNTDNLDEKKDEPDRLSAALQLNEPLAKAYYMRDELNLIWRQSTYEDACCVLLDWAIAAKYSGVKMLEKFAKTVLNHWEGIVDYHKHRISTGPLEAANNNVKRMIRQAYGLRDKTFFHLKIKSVHKQRLKFVG